MLRRNHASPLCSLLVLAALLSGDAGAQRPVTPDPQAEFHLGMLVTQDPAPFAGLGVNIRAGWYARLGLSAEVGAARVGDVWQGTQQFSATARFVLDPFGERRRGFYGGAGLGVRRVGSAAPEGVLLLMLGAEGAARPRKLVPAIEVGLGAGARVHLVLRRGRADTR